MSCISGCLYVEGDPAPGELHWESIPEETSQTGPEETDVPQVSYPVVTEGTLYEAGISETAIRLIADIIQTDVDYGFPGAQLAVIRYGKLVYRGAWGWDNAYLPDGSVNPDRSRVTDLTLYDLASLTKMFATNYCIQLLVTEGKLDIDTPVTKFLGNQFADDTWDVTLEDGVYVDITIQRAWKSKLTVRDLLKHQGGFPEGFRKLDPEEDRTVPGTVGVTEEEAREATFRRICQTPLLYEPGTRTLYSDIDYMILGLVVEQVTGMDLDSYCRMTFWEPLGLTHITYEPLLHGFQVADCAATELNGNTRDGLVQLKGLRTEMIQGEVHDENAYNQMGGISGHAGLFANATDLSVLASLMLTGGAGDRMYFSDEVIRMFTAPVGDDNTKWGLGWWRQGNQERTGYFGTGASAQTIGHQGWTGTLALIDPEEELVLVLLTNKINTPVTSSRNPNKFNGNWYTTAGLGFAPELLYRGMTGNGDETLTEESIQKNLLEALQELLEKAQDQVPKGSGKNHPAVMNLKSKIEVCRRYAQEFGDEALLKTSEELAEAWEME
ncbi:MAG: penicillin binding protein PBP4B [Butyrivibrio sp.]|nr:penicillin binding protein PBP4B [Butyrivibrio sp.]